MGQAGRWKGGKKGGIFNIQYPIFIVQGIED
jgi:hypothetical protein